MAPRCTWKFSRSTVAATTALAAVFLNLAANNLQPAAGEFRFVCLDPPPTTEEIAKRQAEERELWRVMSGGAFYKPLTFLVDFPGLKRPRLKNLDQVDLPDSTPVAGVEVDGETCAFVLNEMIDPAKHIVNMMMNSTPISVTYCDLVDCVRVLTDDTEAAISLDVGGLDVDRQMVFRFEGELYGQASPFLPLKDYPFERMSLGEWKRQHPSTQIYIPPILDY